MYQPRLSGFLITFLAFTSHFLSLTEGIDSQDRDGKENDMTDGNKNDTPFSNIYGASSTSTTSQTVVVPESCVDRSGHNRNKCPQDVSCANLPKDCFECSFNCTCVYGQEVEVKCYPREKSSSCEEISMNMTCRYCYQTEHWEHTCEGTDNCQAVSSPREMFTSNCTVNSDILCLGNRSFPKRLPCNWTSGYKWSTALLLSITLGGFGADRFYLGHWQEGIGKLFSFGGLGVWTIMDVILIAIRYLGPADGSLYI
ncbi:TM2 domain-containing protein 3 [Macrobrachium rosenbergii]|uniref:TM2 domain-containing protein 3 n=1 Tax=Macrobrachium rosenbergii TaxID=79674 RepID=UPI0034D6E85F